MDTLQLEALYSAPICSWFVLPSFNLYISYITGHANRSMELGFACSEWKESWLESSEFASRFRSKSALTQR